MSGMLVWGLGEMDDSRQVEHWRDPIRLIRLMDRDFTFIINRLTMLYYESSTTAVYVSLHDRVDGQR